MQSHISFGSHHYSHRDFLLRRLENSRVGRSWNAIREDEDAAELMGVDTFKFKLWAFAIGAAIGGLAGSLYAGKVQFINPSNFPLQLSILFLAAVVLGGAGNMWGAIVEGHWWHGCQSVSAVLPTSVFSYLV